MPQGPYYCGKEKKKMYKLFFDNVYYHHKCFTVQSHTTHSVMGQHVYHPIRILIYIEDAKN